MAYLTVQIFSGIELGMLILTVITCGYYYYRECQLEKEMKDKSVIPEEEVQDILARDSAVTNNLDAPKDENQMKKEQEPGLSGNLFKTFRTKLKKPV